MSSIILLEIHSTWQLTSWCHDSMTHDVKTHNVRDTCNSWWPCIVKGSKFEGREDTSTNEGKDDIDFQVHTGVLTVEWIKLVLLPFLCDAWEVEGDGIWLKVWIRKGPTSVEPECLINCDEDSFLETVPGECCHEHMVKFIETTGGDCWLALFQPTSVYHSERNWGC